MPFRSPVTAVSGFCGRCYYNLHPLLVESCYLGNGCEYLLSSYDARPRPVSKLRRIVELLGLWQPSHSVSWSSSPGSIYLREGSARALGFGDKLQTPESEIVPNNAVGTLAFRKRWNIEPQGPFLA